MVPSASGDDADPATPRCDLTSTASPFGSLESSLPSVAVLARIGGVLATSILQPLPLDTIARSLVPELADGSVLTLLTDVVASPRTAVADPDVVRATALSAAVQTCLPVPPAAELAKSPRNASASLKLDLNRSDGDLNGELNGFVASLRSLGYREALRLPIANADLTFGDLWLLRARSHQWFGPSDVALALEVARLVAIAFENVRLFRDAQMSIQTRDLVLSAVAHDLRNRLQQILLTAEGTRHRTQRRAPLRLIGARVERIEQFAKRMSAFVGELEDASRLQLGQDLPLHRQATDLVQLVRNAVEEHQRTTNHHTVRFVTLASDLVGWWDASRLERVVGNLLSNAIKYTPGGGAVEVTTSLDRQKDVEWAVLIVRDSGVGIPSEDLDRVFNWFYRSHNVAGSFPGSGIGLAASRHVIQRLNGSITVESTEGRGSTFTVRLPITGPERLTDG
jgi:signal transduction histidine kinase